VATRQATLEASDKMLRPQPARVNVPACCHRRTNRYALPAFVDSYAIRLPLLIFLAYGIGFY
jgi:hypothetical protein